MQYLNEAHATEMGLTRVLQSQIAMTPSGSYRSALERHLDETRSHAERVQARLSELDAGRNPLSAGLGIVESVLAQALAVTKTPLDLLRGSGGEEKLLKNAKDTCATEASRSPLTRRSSTSPSGSATPRRPSWPLRFARTRSACWPA